MNKIVWVTGASGFIGRNLLEQAPKDWDVYQISTVGEDEPHRIVFNPLLLNANLDTLPLPNIVIHLGAASKPTAIGAITQNVNYTKIIAEYLIRKKVRCKFIFASTINVYGPREYKEVLSEESSTKPTTEYATSKLMCETMLSYYTSAYPEFQVRILRFPGVVGKYMTHGLVVDVVEKLKKHPDNLLLLGTNPGTNKIYIHADDACHAILEATKDEYTSICKNIVYWLEGGLQLSAINAAKIVAKNMGVNPKISFSGHSYPGDFSTPRIISSLSTCSILRKYKDVHEAFEEGVKDYLCATS
jgi:nucleoside-diphosphate-sugar epimerase